MKNRSVATHVTGSCHHSTRFSISAEPTSSEKQHGKETIKPL